ncbi:putative F-box/FBD/LRR-repeat protein At4g03220 [Rutidosis leptorrhynchoides]|uniref:putative F-box/FBD/LRR-repeat protein At4g03220 n=1 Tax=Rutidosis leptorrhynchoides TaxID=125765 RepID=UPI003A98CE59
MDFDHNNVRAALNEDRLISLPHELIHQILSRFDTKFVVQTCLLLSPRWKLIWTSMPCLDFSSNGFKTLAKFSKFVTHVLSHRNHQVEVSSVKLNFRGAASQAFVRKIATYAFSHNVQEISVICDPKNHYEFPPCLFSSQTLKHVTFKTYIYEPCLTPKTPWDFPALTTLHLKEISLCDDERESINLFSKCVNLENLTLERVKVKAKVFDIITPRLSNLRLLNHKYSNVINVIAHQLENLTITESSINDLNIPSGLSSFCYKGYHPPRWFKKCVNSVNNVTVSLYMYCPKVVYKQEDARGIINMLQELHSARYLALNLDIVECISAFPDLLYAQPSPFSNMIRLNIDSGTRDTCKVKMSTEARNFLLENSPNATFIMKELPTEAMKNKEAKAKLVADIEDVMKELQASLEQDNILTDRNQAIDKAKVVIENLVDDIKVWTNKKMLQIESERVEIEENMTRLRAQLRASMREMKKMSYKEMDYVIPLILNMRRVRSLLDRLPKRQRKQMEAHYSRQLEQAEALIARPAPYKILLEKFDDAFRKNGSSTSEDVSSSTHPLPSQTSCSSTIVPTPSTSSFNPMP